MAGLDFKAPAAKEREDAGLVAHNTRVGVLLFMVYVLFYGGFMTMSAFWPEAMGNHRVRVKVLESGDAVKVHIPWRRRDKNPQEKAVLAVDAATGKEITMSPRRWDCNPGNAPSRIGNDNTSVVRSFRR